MGLSQVEQIHLLINAGNAFTRWQGKTVGRITLVFDGAPPLVVPLVLGANVREWHTSNGVVSSAPEVTEVWRGAPVNSPEITGVLDMLTIEVPADRREAKLVRMEIEDLSAPIMGSRDPALTIAGATLAHRSAAPRPTQVAVRTPRPTATPTCPEVTGPFASLWATLRDSLGCATNAAISGLVAEQNFVGGQMLWREPIDTAQMVVLYRNGKARVVSHAPYVEGSPEFACVDANTPAVCPPTPKRGFGQVWCDVSDVRRQLGEALDCERGYTGYMQLFEHGFMLLNDTGAIYVVYDDGRWERR